MKHFNVQMEHSYKHVLCDISGCRIILLVSGQIIILYCICYHFEEEHAYLNNMYSHIFRRLSMLLLVYCK